MPRGSFAFFLLALLACNFLRVSAFVPYLDGNDRPLRWNLNTSKAASSSFNQQTKAIRYYIGGDGWSATNRAAELTAVRASFGQWQSIPGTAIRFEEAGVINGVPAFKEDGTNVVYWSAQVQVPDNTSLFNRVGYTRVYIDETNNEIIEADVVLNGAHFAWITDVTSPNEFRYFVEAVLTHEIGHLLGLDHTPVGAATVVRGGPGISTEAGLSIDEVAAARWLYPAGSLNLGGLTGLVQLNGSATLGAIVTVEDEAGNVVAGTVTDRSGIYRLPAIAPGTYSARVSPLDPATAGPPHVLMQGKDIGPDHPNSQTEFLTTENVEIVISAGSTTTRNWTLTPGTPLRITGVLTPTIPGRLGSVHPHGMQLRRGGQALSIGVVGATLPTGGALLGVTGDGIALSVTEYRPNRYGDGRNAIMANITVAPNATPGLRSFVVIHEGKLAYANGYLEILPDKLDYDFDGLDDLFQRRYWTPFTVAAADPSSDPDGDRHSNFTEFLAGSNPIDRTSFIFAINGIRQTSRGMSISFDSVPGKQYQAWMKHESLSAPWQKIGGVITATSTNAAVADGQINARQRTYHIEALSD